LYQYPGIYSVLDTERESIDVISCHRNYFDVDEKKDVIIKQEKLALRPPGLAAIKHLGTFIHSYP